MAALQFKAVKLEGPPPPTGGARSTHKRELVHPTNWLTQHSHWMRRLTMVHSPTGHSSMEGWSYSAFPTMNFLLSSGVSCTSISSTTLWSCIQGSNWNFAIPLFLAINSSHSSRFKPLKNGLWHSRLQGWTVNSAWTVQKDLCYGTICVHNMTNLLLLRVSNATVCEDRQITMEAHSATSGTATQWQDLKYTHTPHMKHTSSNKVVVIVTITQCQPTYSEATMYISKLSQTFLVIVASAWWRRRSSALAI